MKRIVSFITGLLALLINFTASAQSKEATANDHSLLWRISGNGLAKPSYLFGTIHIICLDDFVWTAKMNEGLTKSEKVCFEMDLDDPAVMMQVAAGLIDKSGKKLHDYFNPEQYKLLQKYMKDSLDMELSLFDQMKPVFLQTLISAKVSVGCANSTSYEDSIMKIATQDHKEILGLETADEQLAVLETLPVDSVVAQVIAQVKGNSDNDKIEYNKMVAAYKAQDLPELYDQIVQSKDLGNDMNAFLDDRNKKWIGRMSGKMKQSSVFFAVGAGHLYGGNGVISLLRKQGYTVTAVK